MMIMMMIEDVVVTSFSNVLLVEIMYVVVSYQKSHCHSLVLSLSLSFSLSLVLARAGIILYIFQWHSTLLLDGVATLVTLES